MTISEQAHPPQGGEAARLPYGRPTLTDLGSLADITKGTGGTFNPTDAPTYESVAS